MDWAGSPFTGAAQLRGSGTEPMSYLQEEGISKRTWYAIIAVGVLHVLLGYALISGLAIKAVKVITGPLETVNIEEPAPPPDEPPPPPPKLEDIPPYVPPPDVQIETAAPPPPTITTQTAVPQPAPTVAPPAPPAHRRHLLRPPSHRRGLFRTPATAKSPRMTIRMRRAGQAKKAPPESWWSLEPMAG